MNNHLVSIILPTYNWNTKWLTESIDSVLNQSYNNFELIIINDASTNNINETILNFQKNDKRIIYIKNKKNIERSASKNKWIKLSKWNYIAFIDDDDIWSDKKKLEKQVEFMEKNLDYWLCWTWIILIDENWNEYDKILNRWWDEKIRNYISGSNQFTHSSIIIRKDILYKSWLFNEKYFLAEDYDLWLRIWKDSKLHNLQEYCLKHRNRKKNTSNKNKFKLKLNAFRVYLQYRNNYPNKISWIMKHLITIFMPKKIVKFLTRSKSIWKKI